MPAWICRTCGVQHALTPDPPEICEICADPRQYIGHKGQEWTTLDDLRKEHKNVIEEQERGIWSIHSDPKFAIGQRAYLVRTSGGNILWDCISLLDDATIDFVRSVGRLSAIAVSHPHYYSSIAEWSRAFGDVPVFIHEYDGQWIRLRDFHVQLWSGATRRLNDDFTLICSGGHFDGYQVGHFSAGADGRGVLFAGDQPQVCADTRWVSFMYSYPNWIPFSARVVQSITRTLDPFEYDRIYGAFGLNVLSDAKQVVVRSKARYIEAIW
jgi:glyoxylase-like metal-dependent hydrolase (beta-lactamase superfamily II)